MGYTYIILLGFVVLVGISIYLLTRPKSFKGTYQGIIAMLDDRIFPGGEEQKSLGARQLEKLLNGKISNAEAKDLYLSKITLYFFERFDSTNDGLINFLRSQNSSKIDFFDNIKLYDFFSQEYEQYLNMHWQGAYMRFKILKNNIGKAKNYKFVEGNAMFEKISGLYKNDIKGKNIDKIFPESGKDWIKIHSRMSKNIDYKTSVLLDKFFNLNLEICSYTTANGYLVVFFSETGKIRNLKKASYA